MIIVHLLEIDYTDYTFANREWDKMNNKMSYQLVINPRLVSVGQFYTTDNDVQRKGSKLKTNR